MCSHWCTTTQSASILCIRKVPNLQHSQKFDKLIQDVGDIKWKGDTENGEAQKIDLKMKSEKNWNKIGIGEKIEVEKN